MHVGSLAQVVISGVVTDVDTREPIPFASIFAVKQQTGTAADEYGRFELALTALPDTLRFGAVGYRSTTRFIASAEPLLITMHEDQLLLNTVVIDAGENPAHPIVRGLIAHKPDNRLSKQPVWQREEYIKTELDLTNLDNRIRRSKLLDPFEFIFNGVDSASDEKPFLPIYVSEQLFSVSYFKGNGGLNRTPLAQRASGVENPTLIEAVRKVQTEVDLYDNYFFVLDKSFISPFNDQALLFYEFYLLDSAQWDGVKCWKLKFKPRRKGETTFFGECWIADTSYALVQAKLTMSADVNINLVDRVLVYQDFSRFDSTNWLPSRQSIVVDFVPTERSPGMIIRKSVSASDYRFEDQAMQPQSKPAYIDPAQLVKSDSFWMANRHQQLTDTETQVYRMMDTLQSLPVYNTYVDWIRTFISGYKEFGKIEIGPLAGLYSNNPIEGHRASVGIWTSRAFSKKVQFGGYVAYGFTDQRFKGGADITWLPKMNPRTFVGIKWRDDITSNHENSEILTDASLFTGLYRRPVPFKLMHVSEVKFFVEQYRPKGFGFKFSALHQVIDPYNGVLPGGGGFRYGYLPFPELQPGRIDTTINSTELVLKLRYAPGEQYFDDAFTRRVLTNRKPAIELFLIRGIKGLGGEYDYHKVILSYQHWGYINPLGWISYRVRVGQVWGTVPFPLLEVAPGNETYFYNPSGFNAVNKYEFAADRFATIHATHHFDGLLLNHIPLMRRLKWREVVVARAMWGTINRDNLLHNAPSLFDATRTDTYMGVRAPWPRPYLETGVGIENIFKVFRVDAVWRLNYLDHSQASRLSLRASLAFTF